MAEIVITITVVCAILVIVFGLVILFESKRRKRRKKNNRTARKQAGVRPRGSREETGEPYEEGELCRESKLQGEIERYRKTELHGAARRYGGSKLQEREGQYREIELCREAEQYGESEFWEEAEQYEEIELQGEIERYRETELYREAEQYGENELREEAEQYGEIELQGEIERYRETELYGEAELYEENELRGETERHGENELRGETERYGESEVQGVTERCGESKLRGETKQYGESNLDGEAKLYRESEVQGAVKRYRKTRLDAKAGLYEERGQREKAGMTGQKGMAGNGSDAGQRTREKGDSAGKKDLTEREPDKKGSQSDKNLAGQKKQPAKSPKKGEFQEVKTAPVISVNGVTMKFRIATGSTSGLKDFLIQKIKKQISTRELLALDSVSFDVYKGEVVGIIGTNGSGKSTLLKIVSGALKPSEGKVIVDRKKVQMLSLGAGFDVELSARENVYLNGAIIGYSKEFIDQNYEKIVEFAELEGFMEEKVKNFSSGMSSRLAFAIATAGDAAEILILDEVLSVGDEFFRKKSLARVKEMIHGGSTVLMVSHGMGTILDNCTKVVWIEKGKLQMVGDAKTVCEAYRNQFA